MVLFGICKQLLRIRLTAFFVIPRAVQRDALRASFVIPETPKAVSGIVTNAGAP